MKELKFNKSLMAVNKLFAPSFISNADYSTHTVTKGYKD